MDAVMPVKKMPIAVTAAIVARSAMRSLLLVAIIAGLCLLVRRHSRVLPTLLLRPAPPAEASAEASDIATKAKHLAAKTAEENHRFGEVGLKVDGTVAGKPKPQPRRIEGGDLSAQTMPSPAVMPSREAPVSTSYALNKGEPQRLADMASPLPGKEVRGVTAAAEPTGMEGTSKSDSGVAAPSANSVAEGVKPPLESQPAKDWANEEIVAPIEGAYAVVYLSRHFVGLCLEGKYIRRYRGLRISEAAIAVGDALVGHWRIVDKGEEEEPGIFRLARADAKSGEQREILIISEGQSVALPALILAPGQMDEISRALVINAWVVIQP